MNDRARYRPFTGDTERKLKLTNSPLVMVLCQFRWPELFPLMQPGRLEAAINNLGDVLDSYPIFRQTREVSFNITAEGLQQTEGGPVFLWNSVDREWNVSISRRFISFSCTGKYSSFEEFSARMSPIAEACFASLQIPSLDRVGVRYVNRLTGEDVLGSLPSMLNKHCVGYRGLEINRPGIVLQRATEQALYSVDENFLNVRSGDVAPGETVDPSVLPINSRSWVLDLDAYREGDLVADRDAVMETAGRLADTAYDYFKFVVSEEFVESCGGLKHG